MRVLICNNEVRHGSGIDAMVAMERRALERQGHTVEMLVRRNRDFDAATRAAKARQVLSTLYAWNVRSEMARRLAAAPVDVVHVHNTVPFLTGAVYDACRGRPRLLRVQSLHNYRAFCLSSYAFRRGHPCAACAERTYACCAAFRCYHASAAQSAMLVLARWIDRARGRPLGMEADAFIAVSEVVRRLHAARGVPAERIHVLPNAAVDLRALAPDAPEVTTPRLVFVGALLAAKGILRIPPLAARLPEFRFDIVGEGEDRPRLERAIRELGLTNVTLHGYVATRDLARLWGGAFLTLVPSVWDEPFCIAIPESYALGIPVLASGAGATAELVEQGAAGDIVDFDRPEATAATIRARYEPRAAHAAMRRAARAAYEARFTEEAYGRRLVALLGDLLAAQRRPLS